MMRRKGFSLLELLIALVIFGIVFSLGSRWFISYQRREQFRNSVSQVVSDLNEIRSNSRKTAFHWKLIRPSNSSVKYTLGTTNIINRTVNLPVNVTFDTTQSAATVTYLTPYGNVAAANSTLRLVQTSTSLAARINIVGVTGKVVAVYE